MRTNKHQAGSGIMHEYLLPSLAHRFPSVLLGSLALILVLCGSLGAGAYLYASATHLISEARRHMNSAADHAQLFFDQREALLRAVAASAVASDSLVPGSTAPELETINTPPDQEIEHYTLLLTQRHWNAIHRTGKLMYSQMDPAQDYRLEQGEGQLHWESQSTAMASRLRIIDQQPDARQIPVVWLHQSDDSLSRLVAYTPIHRKNRDGGWLGLELKDIDRALTLSPPPAGAEYMLFDIRGQAVLHSSAPLDASELRLVQEDYFGFSGSPWPTHIVLSKSIGAGGLRVLYALPIRQLLQDGRSTLITTLLILSVFTTAILVGAGLIRRRLLLPARQQQQNLIDSVSLNRKLVAMAPVGLALVDAQGDVIFQENPQARAWIQNDEHWRSRLPGAEDQSACTDVTLEDGRSLRIHAISLNYRGSRAALCSVIDVTSAKAEEAALRHARQLAENANIAKTQFLTTMSHEIRTPLYGILGTLELLSRSEIQQHQTPYLDTLRRSAETLFRVVGESLDLSRIEAGHVTLEPREFCPQELIDEVIAAFSATAQNKGLLLYSVTPVRAFAPTIGDPLRIRQILNNLVSNAIKFTTSGHVVLRLHTEPQPGNRLALRFQVTDSGHGISAEVLPKLFLPYFSLNEGASGQPGTGLGLPICQRLASLMGGSLAVVSEPGLGTSITFEVILPLAPSSETAIPSEPRLAMRPVYVVGDIPEIVSNVSKWLRHWGAYALPYSGQTTEPGAVLVRSWPSLATSTPEWKGRQVIVLPNAQAVAGRQTEVPNCFYVTSTAMGDIMLAVQQAQSRDCAPDAASGAVKETTRQHYVLVVDDNPVNRQILQEQLSVLGCTTQLESSGESALEIPDKKRFDVVFTDLFMPGMDGYGLARALRAQGYCGRIIGVTANAILDKNQEWSAAGMDALLIKPLSMASLRDALLAAGR